MREIKFRAWDKAQNKMLNVIEMDWEPHGTDEHGNFKREVCYVRAQNINDYGDVEHYVTFEEIKELKFDQYTGLCDSNGKEIYEGDIVHVDSGLDDGFNDEIIWGDKDEYPAFDLKKHAIDYGSNALNEIISAGFETIKIIGNIHENPEILEEV